MHYFGFATTPAFAIAVNTPGDNELYASLVSAPGGFTEGSYIFVEKVLRGWSTHAPPLVLDVGGNFAAISILSAVLGARVHAVEGNPATAEYFRHNVILNCVATRVDLTQSLVSDKDETVSLDTSTSPFSGAVTITKGVGAGPSIAARSLDSIFSRVRERAAILKMDIEGYETQALRGARRLLDAFPPYFVVYEMNPSYIGRAAAIESITTLQAAGYTLYLLGTQAFIDVAIHEAGSTAFAAWRQRPIPVSPEAFLDSGPPLSFDLVGVHRDACAAAHAAGSSVCA